jgi:hypothetical protein
MLQRKKYLLSVGKDTLFPELWDITYQPDYFKTKDSVVTPHLTYQSEDGKLVSPSGYQSQFLAMVERDSGYTEEEVLSIIKDTLRNVGIIYYSIKEQADEDK